MAVGIADELFRDLCPDLLEDYLAVQVVHYPLGYGGLTTLPAGVTRTVLLALDAMLGTNELPGDGAITRDASGDRERRTGYLQIRTNVTVTEKDLWRIHGKMWSTQRLDAEDAHPDGPYQGWRITTDIPRKTSHPSSMLENRPLQRG